MGEAVEGSERGVIFFDIDNCLYSKKMQIHEVMGEFIRQYIVNQLNLPEDEAEKLHQTYYKDYGLAIEGLVRHNQVDALDYNAKVDDRLPLESILAPDPKLREFLKRVRKDKFKMWLFTNAYSSHAERVTRILGVRDLFDGVTFCDYATRPLLCKPMPQMFQKAMKDAGLGPEDYHLCYFVDDSAKNIEGARKAGWKAIQLDENVPNAPGTIHSLEELPEKFPECFLPN